MYNKLCRACLSTKETFNYFLCENVSAEVYLFCTSVEVSETEEMPKALCDNCYELLTQYLEFKQTCIKSQNLLLNCKSAPLVHESLKICESTVKSSINVDETKSQLVDIKEETTNDYVDEPVSPKSPDMQESESKSIVKIRKRRKHCLNNSNLKILKHFKYSCKLCSKRFRYSDRFEAHKLEHEGKKMALRCIPCNKSFITWGGLRRHNETEHVVISLDRLSCRTCGRICKSKASLQMHQKTHGPRSDHICHICGKCMTTAVALSAHLETHKSNRDRPHTCEHCGKKFYTNTTLLSHISRLHTGRRYICEHCNYPFTDKYNLSKHLLIHAGKKLYKCDICDKSYSKNNSLIEHKRIHSGERPFGCSYCCKNFISKRRLIDHHRIHTGEKPHRCGVCGQRFTQRGTLQRHMKVHDKIVHACD